jgi:hypothetical protein
MECTRVASYVFVRFMKELKKENGRSSALTGLGSDPAMGYGGHVVLDRSSIGKNFEYN